MIYYVNIIFIVLFLNGGNVASQKRGISYSETQQKVCDLYIHKIPKGVNLKYMQTVISKNDKVRHELLSQIVQVAFFFEDFDFVIRETYTNGEIEELSCEIKISEIEYSFGVSQKELKLIFYPYLINNYEPVTTGFSIDLNGNSNSFKISYSLSKRRNSIYFNDIFLYYSKMNPGLYAPPLPPR